MRRKYVLPVLMVLFLFMGAIQVQAETGKLQTERVTITDENRFKAEYYQQPQVRYPAEKDGKPRKSREGEKTLEEYVVASLKQLQKTIDVSAYNVPREGAEETYLQILNSNPGLFYVSKEVSVTYYEDQDTIIAYDVKYTDTADNIKEQRQQFEVAADQAAAQANESMTDVEKALAVHDYLVQNCEYDYENFLLNQIPYASHTAYGALVNKYAVCDGYGNAYSYIMEDKLGIPCEQVTSEEMSHAWNIIQIGEKWYHVDATWDDPTWDCIGRVGHNYFLVSDELISDEAHEHYGWEDSTNRRADSDLYDDAFWSEITSAIFYYQNGWYYSEYRPNTKQTVLLRRRGLFNGTPDRIHTVDNTWNNFVGSFMYPSTASDRIYFNTGAEIFQMTKEGRIVSVFKPEIPDGQAIFGFIARGRQLYYSLAETPNLESKQVILSYTLPEDVLPEIEGIHAGDIKAAYNGTSQQIVVEGTIPGDVIQYSIDNELFDVQHPQLINAGSYQVWYKVFRSGYKTLSGSVKVEIEKAVPSYTVPTGLTGISGTTLGMVRLPENFVWQEDPETPLKKEGIYDWKVSYVPEDTNNYISIQDITVTVTVKCPGHQYTSQVTKEPTETEKGEETHVCKHCGHTYVTEIDLTFPTIEGITVEGTRTTFNGKPQKIVLKGLQEGDVVQYAGEDGEYSPQQPEMIDAGIYQVLYRVDRRGHQPLYGRERFEIRKAIPSYTVPTELRGVSGTTLGEVELPECFVWQTDPATKLYQEGTYWYMIKYVPEDSKNYETVTNILVEIAVSCPGHRYIHEVIKEPTETEKGQEKYTCTICGDWYIREIDASLPQIEGIYVENVSVVYNGQPQQITVEGAKDGDIVEYSADGETYGDAQPQCINAGAYQIWYRVLREGHRTFYAKAQIDIRKAVPNYTVPTNLKGASGKLLASVILPENFVWQEDTSVKLYQEGVYNWKVSYIPKDSANYLIITDIPVSVTVTCPGHRYVTLVIEEATETKKGLELHTCSVCADAYTEEIPMLLPTKPGNVSGLTVKKQTANSLSFSWKQVNGVKYRLVLYKGNKKLSTKYVNGSSYTWKNLDGATDYTLQVTPYREVNGQKIYAVKSGQVKTATAPGTVKISSVKKSGSKKAKITWKKFSGATGYEIYMKTGNSSYKKIKTITDGKKTSYTKSGLKKGKKYSFYVRAYKKVNGVKLMGGKSKVKTLKIK